MREARRTLTLLRGDLVGHATWASILSIPRVTHVTNGPPHLELVGGVSDNARHALRSSCGRFVIDIARGQLQKVRRREREPKDGSALGNRGEQEHHHPNGGSQTRTHG